MPPLSGDKLIFPMLRCLQPVIFRRVSIQLHVKMCSTVFLHMFDDSLFSVLSRIFYSFSNVFRLCFGLSRVFLLSCGLLWRLSSVVFVIEVWIFELARLVRVYDFDLRWSCICASIVGSTPLALCDLPFERLMFVVDDRFLAIDFVSFVASTGFRVVRRCECFPIDLYCVRDAVLVDGMLLSSNDSIWSFWPWH